MKIRLALLLHCLCTMKTYAHGAGTHVSENQITISGYISGKARLGNVMMLEVWTDFASVEKFQLEKHLILKKRIESGKFSFIISNIRKPIYFSLSNYKNQRNVPVPILSLYFAEPGDNILIDLHGVVPLTQVYDTGPEISGYDLSKTKFFGPGYAKFECQKELDMIEAMQQIKLEQSLNQSQSAMRVAKKSDSISYFEEGIKYDRDLIDELESRVRLLNSFKAGMGKNIYDLILADQTGKIMSKLFYNFRLSTIFLAKKKDSLAYADYYRNVLSPLCPATVTNKAAVGSIHYLQFLFMKLSLDKFYFDQNESVYEIIKETYRDGLRDKLLAAYLSDNFENLNDAEKLKEDAFHMVSSAYLKQEIRSLGTVLKEGRPAFKFTLRDAANAEVRLSDFKGKVVFMDFWFVGCAGCEQFYKWDLSIVENEFRSDSNVVFITVNPDRKENWIKALETGVYTSTQSVNLNTGISGFESPVIKFYQIVGYPRPVLIDRKGNVFCLNEKLLRSKESLERKIREAEIK